MKKYLLLALLTSTNSAQDMYPYFSDMAKQLEFEKKKTERIKDWKYRLENKEQESLAKELNKIRNG